MADKETSPWPTVTLIGVLCGITFGLVLYSLLAPRRRDDENPNSLNGLDVKDLLPPTVLPQIPHTTETHKKSSSARTLTVSDSKPTMVLRATNGDWKVSVRVLSPHSAFAYFTVGQSTDNMIVVPSGSSQDLWLPKGEYLYAKGDQSGVCVSVSGGEV